MGRNQNEAAKFRKQLENGLLRVNGLVVVFQKKIAFEGLRGLVAATPVDTGRARAAWITTLGAPTSVTPPATHVDQAPLGADSGPAVSEGFGAIEQLKLGNTVYIQNNVHYITELERGKSSQAPEGMLRPAIERIRQAIQELGR